jgi:hypothetical protein
MIEKCDKKYFVHDKTVKASDKNIQTKITSGFSPFENQIVRIWDVDCTFLFTFGPLDLALQKSNFSLLDLPL